MATCPYPEGGIVALSHAGAHCQPLRQQQPGLPEVQEVELGLFGIMCFWSQIVTGDESLGQCPDGEVMSLGCGPRDTLCALCSGEVGSGQGDGDRDKVQMGLATPKWCKGSCHGVW